MFRALPAIAVFLFVASAGAQTAAPRNGGLPEDKRFCPSWAEAHERTMASLGSGRRPPGVRWKGCVTIKKGTQVEIVDSGGGSTEIIYKTRRWFADEDIF
jgi:hypothetical protein